MIQSQNQNPCLNVFSTNPIQVNTKYYISSFICSFNKTQFGIYYYYYNRFRCRCFKCLKGEIILLTSKKEKWTEYFRMNISSNCPLKLVCFTNCETQLLFHQKWSNQIESLTIGKKNIFGLYSYLTGTIDVFFKLQSQILSLLSSNDQKMILINCKAKYYLLDVISKTVILTLENELYQGMSFFESTYLIQTRVIEQPDNEEQDEEQFEEPILNHRKKYFFKIMNKKVEKILYFCKNAYLKTSLGIDNIYQLNCKSIGCFLFGKKGKQALMVLNMINLKFIRKIVLIENINHLSFLGFSQNYVLHSFFNHNRIYMQILDLFSLNVEIIDLNLEVIDLDQDQSVLKIFEPYKQINFDNQILMVKNSNLKQTQFWLANQ